LGLDAVFLASDINPASLVHLHEEAGLLSMLSSVVLWSLVVYLLVRKFDTNKSI
jgi:hypothetical protein